MLVGILIGSVGILIGSVGILIGSVGILIHWYFEHWYFERWYFEPLPKNPGLYDLRRTLADCLMFLYSLSLTKGKWSQGALHH